MAEHLSTFRTSRGYSVEITVDRDKRLAWLTIGDNNIFIATFGPGDRKALLNGLDEAFRAIT